MDDEALAKKLSKNDQDAFIYMMDKYNKLVWFIVSNVLKDIAPVQDIEECVSDVYVQVWKNAKAYDRKKGSFKRFLITIAKNKSIDMYRKISKNKNIEFSDSMSMPGDGLLDMIVNKEGFEILYESINSLKEPDREILIRRYFLDEKPASIANSTSIPVKEIENRLYRSKLKLKTIINELELMQYFF